MLTFAGSHACGKTSVIIRTAQLLSAFGIKVGVMKLDCISSDDDNIYNNHGILCKKYISGNVCPDHYFAGVIEEVFEWGEDESLDVLITESAGLCGRCAPHIKDIGAVCIIDCLAGISAPSKAGPMLRYADFIAVTKGDLVSPAEREIFLHSIRQTNPRAVCAFINGLTGQGASRLAEFISGSGEIETVTGKYLRFTMPSATCTYCSGQRFIGKASIAGRIKPEI